MSFANAWFQNDTKPRCDILDQTGVEFVWVHFEARGLFNGGRYFVSKCMLLLEQHILALCDNNNERYVFSPTPTAAGMSNSAARMTMCELLPS